jgi:N12 class adenine-specific DNA methylase
MRRKFEQNVAAIRLLREIEADARVATPEQKSVLVKYTGWGGLPQVFATPDEAPKWKSAQQTLKELLLPDEFQAARATVLNAHYTSPTVIRAMYAAVGRLGFAHGRVLEPACGLGHFFGLMPDDARARSQLTGVEIDPLTARLARMLYPDAEIRARAFEDTALPTNSFDLAISNVPFGDYAPHDPKLNARKFHIHDYYFVAGLERVRPGGLVAFITSRGTMDKQYPHLRDAVAKSANLVAAIRLPNTAFKKNANTEVTTDIVILRKRAPGEPESGPAWRESRPMAEGSPIFLNEYYHANPAMMLGRMERAEHGMYGREEVRLADDGRDLGEALTTAVAALPSGIYEALTAEQSAKVRRAIPAPPGVKPNAYVLTEEGGGGVARREGDELILLTDVSVQTARRIRRLIHVRDAVRECLRTQVENRNDNEVAAARFRLNQDYDYFAGQFGPISDTINVRTFAGDPDLPLLLSLENYHEDTNTATKTAIFHERTIQPRVPVTQAAGAKEALLVTLSEKGRVDLEHIGRLLGKPAEEFLPELAGAIYLNPVSRQWETDDEYLSGNVREKLAVAERVAESDPSFGAHAEALRGVQPTDLKATEIDARLGAVWIPADDVAAFARELLRLSRRNAHELKVRHVPALGLWSVDVSYATKASVANRSEWGTERVPAHELIEDALNLRTPTVYDSDDEGKPRINPGATEGAREKQQKIKDRFAEWIWQDDERRERLVAFYNREFNHHRLRTFTGDHLTLPGASPTITLRAHQKAAVWRIVQSWNVLLGHVVGAGKTYTMVAAAMELKRLGLARKPLFVVPNHMLGQFSSELLMLYPSANILVAGKSDFESGKRRELMGRIATGNWDAVIVTHSGFERLPLSAKTQKDFFDAQLGDLERCIREQKADEPNSRIVKELERAKRRLEAKLKGLAAEHRKDDTLTFEELGIDRLFVDEAQAFKNLFYVTKMTRVAGLPQAASERAFDMFLKVQHVQRVNGGGGVVFATGTPVTNTMAEMFTMQRYLQMDTLRRQKLEHFDSWAATYGETVTAMELAPDGAGYRLNTRFARFVNVPELMQTFRQMADIQTADMLKLPVPELDGGKPRIVRAPSTPALKVFVASLAVRAEKLKTTKVDPRDDNMLKITGEGRKAALDIRLVMPAGPDHPDSKANLAVREILSVWQETRAHRLTQMVFCDLSTPKTQARGLSVYSDVKAKLVALGVPTAEIQFIQDHDSDAAKSALFKDVRSGKVRILMGSTQKMGAGTNVQAKLVALHHLDAPWRPADIEQREGRIRRQGNSNATVRILRYVTEGSFDAYSWQLLETKAKFIAQVMTGHSTARRIEDLDSPALTYAEVKAIASGNPLVIEKAKVDSEVMRLSRLRSEHQEAQYSGRNRIRMHESDVTRLERHVASMEQDLKLRRDTSGEKFEMTVDGQKFTERAKAGAALIYVVEDHRTDHLLGRPQTATLGEVGGFKIEFRSTNADKVNLRGTMEYPANVSPSPVGIVSSLEHAVRGIDEHLGRCREDLSRAKSNLAELSALSGRVFEHEERYRELIDRQAELVTKLDLTKNQASSQQAAESTDEVATTPDEPAAPREQPEAVESMAAPEKKKPAELMTPKEYRAAGLGPANDAIVLGALRAGKPVSALAVDEYNLKHALPRGYWRDGDEFVPPARKVMASVDISAESGSAAITDLEVESKPAAAPRVTRRKIGAMKLSA